MTLDREKFTKIVSMLGSSHEGEQLAAVRRANAMLQKAGMTWAEALRLKTHTVTKVIERVVVREVAAAAADFSTAGQRIALVARSVPVRRAQVRLNERCDCVDRLKTEE